MAALDGEGRLVEEAGAAGVEVCDWQVAEDLPAHAQLSGGCLWDLQLRASQRFGFGAAQPFPPPWVVLLDGIQERSERPGGFYLSKAGLSQECEEAVRG